MTYTNTIESEVIQELLTPGYTPIETGYLRLPNGVMHAKALLRMPTCKGKIVNWWFGYLHDTSPYKFWHSAHVYFKWDDKRTPAHYIGAIHQGQEYLGGNLAKIQIKFHDPAEIFDTSKFKAANIGAVIYAIVLKDNGLPDGHMIHTCRDTEYGCDMRSRFWFSEAPDEVGLGVMTHHLEERWTIGRNSCPGFKIAKLAANSFYNLL